MDDNTIEYKLGEIVAILKSVQESICQFKQELKENDIEHKSILDKLELYALQRDVNAIADRVRKLEEKPTKEKAGFIDGFINLLKKGAIFLLVGIGIYLLVNLKDIYIFFVNLITK